MVGEFLGMLGVSCEDDDLVDWFGGRRRRGGVCCERKFSVPPKTTMLTILLSILMFPSDWWNQSIFHRLPKDTDFRDPLWFEFLYRRC